jgi:trans-aconitate methyltransferase
MSLEKKYFDEIYAKDSLIDGDYNASSHARYLKSIFELVEAEVSSLVDFGFGKGNLLYQVAKTFKPGSITAIDNSSYAYEALLKKHWVKQWKLDCRHQGILDFEPSQKAFDLGLCNSVLQYVPDEDLELCIERMSYSCRYLYLHVPSREDYEKLKYFSDFEDPYAISRGNEVYRELVSRYFVSVSWGLLESKTHVDVENSAFFDSLYRL